MYYTIPSTCYCRFMENDVTSTLQCGNAYYGSIPAESSCMISKTCLASWCAVPLSKSASHCWAHCSGPMMETFGSSSLNTYSKLYMPLTPPSTSATMYAYPFRSNSVYPYGMPYKVLTGNGSQFVSMFFERLCPPLGNMSFMTTNYHPSICGKMERCRCALIM